LALFSVGVLASFSIYAADDIHTTTSSTALSTGGTADAWGDKSTAVGENSVAGGNITSLTTYRSSDTGIEAYVAPSAPGKSDGTTGIDSDGNYRYKDGTIISTIDDFTGSNTKNTAIGKNARALYGNDINPITGKAYNGGSSTAVGMDSLAMIGGTAVGNEAYAIGKDSVAIGKETKAFGYKSTAMGEDTEVFGAFATGIGQGSAAGGLGGSAFGSGASAEGEESTALGYEAEATGENSVALGAGSLAERENTVSVGNAETGSTRTISNVAPGVYGTDAVNVNQLKAVERKISAGVSAAMAMTTPVIAAGKSNAVALGAASYNNTSAVALNLAHKFTDDVVATASVSKGFNSGRTSSGSNDDIGIKGSVSWSF